MSADDLRRSANLPEVELRAFAWYGNFKRCRSMSNPGTLSLTHEGSNVYRLDLTGVLRKADFDQSSAAIAREIDRAGPVKLLVVLTRFEGWDTRDNWSDLTFYATYGDRIARLAIVGDERWRTEMLMFAVADLRTAPVEYFAGPAVVQARAWLGQ